MKTDNKILELSFDFSISAISLYKKLIAEKEYVIKTTIKKRHKYWSKYRGSNCCPIKERFYFKNVHSLKGGKRNKVLVTPFRQE